MIMTVRDDEKEESLEIARRFEALGYKIYATRRTAEALTNAGIQATKVNKFEKESPSVEDLLLEHRLDLVIDTPTRGQEKKRDGFLIRRIAIETGVHVLTSLDTAAALATALENSNQSMTAVDIAEISQRNV